MKRVKTLDKLIKINEEKIKDLENENDYLSKEAAKLLKSIINDRFTFKIYIDTIRYPAFVEYGYYENIVHPPRTEKEERCKIFDKKTKKWIKKAFLSKNHAMGYLHDKLQQEAKIKHSYR